MIVRMSSTGSSFKGLAEYLTHDADKAKTDERVAWTHTLNCASDDVPGAVNEMQRTSRDAELLKQEAGIRAGGRATENPVKHISLNWSPEDNPSREHMIETSQDFLRHMKWQDHQAVLISHDDKKYAHVHIMLNTIHPETGLKLDDSFERRRAQEWAAGYERENGKIYCEERLKDPREREDSAPRNVWMAFQKAERDFSSDEKSRRESAEKWISLEENSENNNRGEWKSLKEFQRNEREDFFAEGKSAFSQLRSSIYSEVREEFRDRWAEYHAERRGGGDEERLAETKAQLVAEQREVLDTRRDAACAELRATRDEQYQNLLDEQRQTRAELRGRQEEGWDNSAFFAGLEARQEARAAEFREAAQEMTTSERMGGADEGMVEEGAEADWVNDIGLSAGRSAFSFFDMAFRSFEGGAAPKPTGENKKSKAFTAAAQETSNREQREREVADEETRRRSQLEMGRG